MYACFQQPETENITPNLKSLHKYGYSVYSQFGEDGIIEEIFNRLNITKGFFVEFGAADGLWLSNTRHLKEKGWQGCYIEPRHTQFKKLQKLYALDQDVLCIHSYVKWKETQQRGKFFDDLAEENFSGQEIDFLSIDVDGGDYYILKSLKCRPKVICIENNLNWHPLYKTEVPEHVALRNLHQPLQVVIDQAKTMGYEPVCLTINLFLVRKDLFAPFTDIVNDTETLWHEGFNSLPKKNADIYHE